tara:strand:+ start:441 stop:854 length:414 start_codon:yes stop_codon:yes gene_type:complete
LNNSISKKDKKDWENFISSKEKIENKDLQNKKEQRVGIRSVDLHGYTLEEANKTIEKFIFKAHSDKIHKLIVITGKGLHSQNEKNPYVSKNLSILKYSVPEFITNNKELMKIIFEIRDAEINDGGSGAFYIFLKKTK